MRKLLFYFLFLLTFSLQSTAFAQDGRKQATMQDEQSPASVLLTVSGNQVRVQHAAPGSLMEVYNILGVKITSVRIDSTDKTVSMNLPKGYYIFKIGNVVRKVVIK